MCYRTACRTGANLGGGEVCPVTNEFINSRQQLFICTAVTNLHVSNADEGSSRASRINIMVHSSYAFVALSLSYERKMPLRTLVSSPKLLKVLWSDFILIIYTNIFFCILLYITSMVLGLSTQQRNRLVMILIKSIKIHTIYRSFLLVFLHYMFRSLNHNQASTNK
jgi:hypothetical protein